MKSQFLDTLKNALSVLLHTDPLLLGALLLGFLADLITGLLLKDGTYAWDWRSHLKRILRNLLVIFGALLTVVPFSNSSPAFGWIEFPTYTALIIWQTKQVIWNVTTADNPLRAALIKPLEVIAKYNAPKNGTAGENGHGAAPEQ